MPGEAAPRPYKHAHRRGDPPGRPIFDIIMIQNPDNKTDRDKLVRISVDFNTASADMHGRVHIPTHVHPELLNILQLGQRVIIFEAKDLEVEAVVEFDEELSQQLNSTDIWFALPDLSTLRRYNEETGQFEKRN